MPTTLRLIRCGARVRCDASTLWPYSDPKVKDEGEFPMNSFLVQVQSKGYSTIDNGSYSNEHWETGDEKQKNENNKDHGEVEPGDRLLIYCGAEVPDKDYNLSLAFSVDVKSVSEDRTTFELGERLWFGKPLKYKTIREYEKQSERGHLDGIFKCGKEGFNITKLKPKEVEQIFDLVEPQIPPRQPRHQTALGRGRRAVRVALRRLRGHRD